MDLWERLAKEPENIVDLGSDQTSLHNPFQGGYYPVTLSFKDARKMMVDDPEKFKYVHVGRSGVPCSNLLTCEIPLHTMQSRGVR